MQHPVIITVPHCVCKRDNSTHSCDTVALDAAMYLEDYLYRIPHVILLADKNRDEMDYNRKRSRRSEYRKILRELLENTEPLCLIDVHSFPPDDPGKWKTCELGIGSNTDLEDYLFEIAEYLIRMNVYAYPVGHIKADICAEAKEFGFPAYLFEFNEGLDKVYRDAIVRNIAEFIAVKFYGQ